MKINNAPVLEQVKEMDKVSDVSRRRFFQLAGGIAGAGVLLAACQKKTPPSTTFLGVQDTALLNYLYVLQQLEAQFYTQAVLTPYYGLTVSESQLLTDVRDQEIAHAEFLKNLLGTTAVGTIVPNFSAVTFSDRSSVLKYATIFEDMSVSAFNGAAHLFSKPDYVYAITKMMSVDARHSSYFRNLLTYNTFADASVIDTFGLDQAGSPATVFAAATNYLQTTFDASKLPN